VLAFIRIPDECYPFIVSRYWLASLFFYQREFVPLLFSEFKDLTKPYCLTLAGEEDPINLLLKGSVSTEIYPSLHPQRRNFLSLASTIESTWLLTDTL